MSNTANSILTCSAKSWSVRSTMAWSASPSSAWWLRRGEHGAQRLREEARRCGAIAPIQHDGGSGVGLVDVDHIETPVFPLAQDVKPGPVELHRVAEMFDLRDVGRRKHLRRPFHHN